MEGRNSLEDLQLTSYSSCIDGCDRLDVSDERTGIEGSRFFVFQEKRRKKSFELVNLQTGAQIRNRIPRPKGTY